MDLISSVKNKNMMPENRSTLSMGKLNNVENPNNINSSDTLSLEFVSEHALSIPSFKMMNANGEIYKGAVKSTMDKKTALRIYQTMRFVRILDERMLAAQRQGRISFYMQCLGEEAAVTASAAALAKTSQMKKI